MTKITATQKKRRERAIKKLVFDVVLFVVLLSIGLLLLYKALGFESEKVVKYNERSDLDYKVYLAKNDFYEQEYLGKDMVYVANLIDKILIDFSYVFSSEDKEELDFTYSVVAKLSITNPTLTKSYFEKTYPLVEEKKISMDNVSEQKIKEQVNLNYPYYNHLATSFKTQYGVDSDSKLTVYMLINKQNKDGSNFVLNSSSVMNVVIPLSERSVDIKLDYKDINTTSNIIKKQSMTIKDILPLVGSVLFVILSLIMVVKAMRNANVLIGKKSLYDKYVGKILKEYDRLIAESSTLLSFEGKEIININKFTELLDIHDNLQLPIMYYEEREHELSYFYISHQNLIYLFEVNVDNIESLSK